MDASYSFYVNNEKLTVGVVDDGGLDGEALARVRNAAPGKQDVFINNKNI